jgi:hypothetical protein
MPESFSMACIVTSVLSLTMSAFVVIHRKRAQDLGPIITWAVFCLAVATWSAGLAGVTLSATREDALFWLRVHYAGAIVIPAIFLHFVTRLVSFTTGTRVLVSLDYLLAALLLVLFLGGEIAAVKHVPPFKFYTSPEPWYDLFTAYYVASLAIGFLILIVKFRRSKNSEE